jgi:hypothetical protein
MGEDFYVTHGLWILTVPEAKRDGIICIGCFEKRLGRKLTKRDFAPWFRKNRWHGDQRRLINDPPSRRLAERLKLPI